MRHAMQVDFHCFLDRHDIWQSITELTRHHARGGVYRVHAFRDDAPRDWRPEHLMPVTRAAGADALGRLYIGSTEVFPACFIVLWRSLSPAHRSGDAHAVGRAYRASAALPLRYPRLCFTVRADDDPAGAQAGELAAYAAEFGELPPLNALLPLLPGRIAAAGIGGPLAAIA